MKTLVIIGSPRQGNSFRVAQRVEERLKALGDVEVEYLWLKDKNLQSCLGCFTCISRGELLCPLQDDRAKIIAKMEAADGLILATPAYFFSVTSLMKNFIDRLAYLTHRPVFFHQHAMVICTSGGAGLKETLNYLKIVCQGWELNLVAKIGAWTPPYPLAAKVARKLEKEIDRAANKFFEVVQAKKPPALGFKNLMHFRFVRYHALLAKEHFPADYRYFEERGLFDANKKYYIDIPVPLFTNTAAVLFEKLVGRGMRKTLLK